MQGRGIVCSAIAANNNNHNSQQVPAVAREGGQSPTMSMTTEHKSQSISPNLRLRPLKLSPSNSLKILKDVPRKPDLSVNKSEYSMLSSSRSPPEEVSMSAPAKENSTSFKQIPQERLGRSMPFQSTMLHQNGANYLQKHPPHR